MINGNICQNNDKLETQYDAVWLQEILSAVRCKRNPTVKSVTWNIL